MSQPHPKKRKAKTTLAVRIMAGVVWPLFFLTAVFMFIQLNNEMKSLNEFHINKSQLVFQSVTRSLRDKMKQVADSTQLIRLEEDMQQWEGVYPEVTSSVYSLLDRQLIVNPHAASWSSSDEKGLEASIAEAKQGKDYAFRYNKPLRSVIAYVPLKAFDGKILAVARVRYKLPNVRHALNNSLLPFGVITLLMTCAGVLMSLGLSRSILKPIKALNDATQELVKGHLGKHVHINTGDEIEDLARTFNHMSDTIKTMKENAEDANPLSGLPGNQGIFQEIKTRISARKKFVLFHTDLDRFKVFNDHFGLAKGDIAITKTADLLREAVKKVGRPDDFVGHQGGDDYVLIVQPGHAKEIAEYITKEFDAAVVKSLYSKEDYERGHTLQIDRRRLAETGEERMAEFPLLALSLAGVTNTKKDFADYFDCMSAAVKVKKEVKKAIESSYMIVE
ncbi:MAG: HAMP domain-containing protein [Candidatus Omnitrophota bacterium]|nr:HAMP domain-containing protein [Candidatus Omnitrophota bacterium]